MRRTLRFLIALTTLGPLVGAFSGAADVRADETLTVGPPVRGPQLQFQKYAYDWRSLKRQNVVMQKRDFSCGAAALATLARYHWGDDVEEIDYLKTILKTLDREQLKDRYANGLSMTDLRNGAEKHGYDTAMVKIPPEKLTTLTQPALIRIKVKDYEHFVILRGLVDDRIFLADPIRGNIRISFERFLEQWPDQAGLIIVKRGQSLPTHSVLMVEPTQVVQPEMQVVRRFFSKQFP